jgi:hypothetical protein
MLADLPSMFGAASPLQWGDAAHVAGLFGERVESLVVDRRRSELKGFADEAELRDFLKAHHPVAVALHREQDDPELRDDPELAATLDDAFLDVMVSLWYARDGGSGALAQEAMLIVARKARAA